MCSWMFTVGSAIGVVYSTYESRRATHLLEELRREEAGLRVVYGQYALEKSSLAAYGRVEKIATQELGMVTPSAEQTIIVVRK